MKKIIIFGLVIMAVLLAACQQQPITSFDECVAAGNPVMQSYPRQCSADGQTFVEDIQEPPGEQPRDVTFTSCPDERPEICTMEYAPVCGLVDNGVRCITEPCASTDAVTFGNDCTACADEATFGHYPGACEEQLFVVCQETVTGFSAEEFAEQNNGICVDICPGNYDAYTTQIGVQLCIPHYGEEKIANWPVCEASNDSCDCVKASETTRGEQIEDAEYRCVPEQYGERMLFRAGKDFLDENGEQGVVIA